MHELAIAQSLIDAAVAQLPSESCHVVRLRVQLGMLAGVSSDELSFGFAAISPQTACAGAHLEVEEISARVHCPTCAFEYDAQDADDLICPMCGMPGVLILVGKDVILSSIEVENEATHG
jgi:hydrogenase nickel incorporation protein HypA/HybF